MNDHLMAGSEKFNTGFIDSGTTFTYFPHELYDIIRTHFELFCEDHGCEVEENICFQYDQNEYQEGPLEYFKKFPTLKFKLPSANGTEFDFVWYASEYLYHRRSDKYCFAADTQRSNEIMMGGTLIRQHNLVFDIDNNQVGFAHAVCNSDSNQVFTSTTIDSF
jgi:hypothetical protein